MAMSGLERKAAFQTAATMQEKTLFAAAQDACGVTWTYLSDVIADKRSASEEVRQKFAAYIGRTVDDVFGGADESSAA